MGLKKAKSDTRALTNTKTFYERDVLLPPLMSSVRIKISAGAQELPTLVCFPSDTNTSSTQRQRQVSNSMKCLNSRADSHLTGQVELEGVSHGAWVNQGFCGTPPPLPRVVSTIYDPKPLYGSSMDSIYKLDPLGVFPEAPPPPPPLPPPPPPNDHSLVKKQRGCCSFVKGRNPVSPVYYLIFLYVHN